MATINGTEASETLVGTAGHDTINGFGGDDIIEGLTGNDWINGGAGVDTLKGGPGDDIYIMEGANDPVTELANEGIDEVRTNTASYILAANVERLIGTSSTGQILNGNALANFILGGAGNDHLNGGIGNDWLDGGAGTDNLFGDVGDDVFVVDPEDIAIDQGNNSYDTVLARGNYTLPENSSIEVLGTVDPLSTAPVRLTGNAFQNLIYGNAGNNVLFSGVRNSAIGDHLNGNGGDDIYFVFDNDLVFENAGNGHDTVIVIPYAGNANYALRAGSHVETLGTIDAQGTDRINLAGNEFQNLIYGNNGRNILTSNGGGDHLNGYGGDDIYFVSAGDLVFESAGNGHDTVNSSTSYALTAGSHVETLGTIDAQATTAIDLTGNEFQNLIYGNEGRNVLTSGGGGDHLNGYGGDDIYFVSTGDLVFEGSGRGYDTVNANSNYTLNGGSHVEVLGTVDAQATTAINLTGNELHNLIYGNEGSNVLTGGGGGDHLHGRGGNDILVEGVGADFLVGGAGADTFLFQNLASGDVIQDFTSGVDKIDLSLIDAKSLQAGNDSFTFIGSAAFSGKGGEVRVQMDGTTAHILADVNGDNVADLHIIAHNVTQLTANDFNL